MTAAYREDWRCRFYRWTAKRIERRARALSYPETRQGLRMKLEDVSDWFVWKAIRRGWRLSK